MICKKESQYNFHIPDDYVQSENFIDSYHDLQLSDALKTKIQHTLDRMPDTNHPVAVSYSGGKDSQVIFILARMKYQKDQLFAMFADTQDEWPETYDAINMMEQWIDVPIHRLGSIGIHELLRHHKSCWPMMGRRFCTKDLKMLPQRDFLDHQGYAQLRIKGGHKYRSGQAYDPIYDPPLMLVGERWNEGGDRKNLPFDTRDSFMLRDVHRPILDWTIEDVWTFLFAMKSPINPVYTYGIKRAACSGCIFAKPEEIILLAKHQPDLFQQWLITEQYINHPRPGFRFSDIASFLQFQQEHPDATWKDYQVFDPNQIKLAI